MDCVVGISIYYKHLLVFVASNNLPRGDDAQLSSACNLALVIGQFMWSLDFDHAPCKRANGR